MATASSGGGLVDYLAAAAIGILGGFAAIAILDSLSKPKCPNCGNELKRGEPICPYCGIVLRWG